MLTICETLDRGRGGAVGRGGVVGRGGAVGGTVEWRRLEELSKNATFALHERVRMV